LEEKHNKKKSALIQMLDKAEGIEQVAQTLINWSDYQRGVFAAIRDCDDNIVVDAVAGSGKTTTLVEAMKVCLERYGNEIRILFCAFNKHIVKALRAKASHLGVTISTLHSKGFADIRATLKGVVFRAYKVHDIYDNLVGHQKYQRYNDGDTIMNHKPGLVQIVGLLKMLMLMPTETNIDMIVDVFGIDIGDEQYSYEYIVGLAIEAFELSIADKRRIDFNDMIYYPAQGIHGVAPIKYHIPLIDELQDLNKCQRILILKTYSLRIIGVGDPFQSIYRFAGADKCAFEAFIDETNALVLPLSITYRCAKAIVRRAQVRVPHIQAAPDAPEGEISKIYDSTLTNVAQEGDIIMCRVNAPLIGFAYDFIRNGKKATVLGKDIGKGLVTLIDRTIRTYQVDNIDELVDGLIDYRRTRGDKLVNQNRNMQAEALYDKIECILHVISSCGAESIFQLKDEIDNLFDEERIGVVLTTIHKFKGQEPDGSGTVFLLHPDRMFPDWGDPEEERNIVGVIKWISKAVVVTPHRLYQTLLLILLL